MRSMVMISMAAAVAAWSLPVQAAPMTWGCDTAAGRFSAIELEVPAAGFEVGGTITPNEFRKDASWAPGAWVRIETADGQNAAEVRYLGGPPKTKEGLVTLSGKIAGAERKGDPQLSALSQPVAFAIRVTGPGEVFLMAGEQKAKLPVAMGDRVKLTAACSTGDFVFTNLEWKSAP